MSKYDEDLKKACEILNNTELDELVQVAVEAMDDAATDIGMEASQEWHAKITLESSLIHIAEKVAKRPQLTIPKNIAEMLDEELNPLERESMLETFVLGINYLVLSDELMKFVLTGNNYHVISAYLAGKALGVDFVKVVEG